MSPDGAKATEQANDRSAAFDGTCHYPSAKSLAAKSGLERECIMMMSDRKRVPAVIYEVTPITSDTKTTNQKSSAVITSSVRFTREAEELFGAAVRKATIPRRCSALVRA